MDLNMYIRPDAFILVPVLFFLGLFLRQTPYLPLWSHVWIQLFFAVIACLLHYGFEIESVVQGILVTGVAVISRDIIHHSLNNFGPRKDKEDKE
ncbi:phage holin family protein [Niallia endozanthoxylica]|uniref:Holin n=1 Tax=Niallia endozanthoxylica TaxID=2036016 RepID=A0A5J5I754_9BACI|nr:phage holin family protein [Niallia endozanthoxylica]KAA9029967.1 holin [Niallia endozanthoxylica]